MENYLNRYLGMTILEIVDCKEGCCEVGFIFNDRKLIFSHCQDCCESVRLIDIIGNVSDLIGKPLTMCEEVQNFGDTDNYEFSYDDSHTWTFYKFATLNGYVTFRWLGELNGYYSETVYCEEVEL
jgi:hypothetical protein